MTELSETLEALRSKLADQVSSAPRVLADVQAILTTQTTVTAGALTLAMRAAELAGQVTPPQPPVQILGAARAVRVGGVLHQLDGVNPGDPGGWGGNLSFPGGRGPGHLIAYAPPRPATGTNVYGLEVVVSGGVCRVASTAGNTTVSSSGSGVIVLSGHGAARDWLAAHFVVGATVEFVTDAPPPPPRPTTGKTIAGYLQDGQDVDTIADCYTQIRVAFVRMTGGVLLPVEWGGKTPAETQRQLTAWEATRPENGVLLSTGGAGGGNNFGLPSAFVAGYRSLAPLYGAHGVDADEEGQLDGARVVAVGKELYAADPSFVASFVPPGGPPVPVALSAAKQLHDAGVPVQFGFQGYDAVDSDDDILGRTADAVAALDEHSTLIGFMIGDDPKHRTPAECESLMRKVVARWPDIGGAYAWQIHAPGTTEAMHRVAAVLGL